MNSGSRSVIMSVVVVVAVSAVLGFASGRWLAGVLVGVALCVTVVGMALLIADSAPLGWTILVVGIALAACATWFTGMDGRWWWLLPWLMIGILAFSAGATCRDASKGRSDTLMTIGVLTTIFAVLGPLVVYGGLAGVRESGVGLPSTGDLSIAPLSDFTTTVFTSFWGYIGVLVIFLIGVSWRGNRGGVVALVFLPIIIVVVGWIDPQAAGTISDWLASGPIDQAARILRGSDAHWGTAGWGVLIAGTAIALIAAASLRRMLRANGLLSIGADLRRRGREEDPPAFMMRNVDAWPYFCSMVVFFGGFFVEPVLMWLALRRVAGDGELPFPAIGMPDLAAPQLWPVWDASYFLVALAAAGVALVLGRLYRRYGVDSRMPVVSNPVWQATTPFIGALFVPGGVMLLGAAAVFTVMIELPIAAAGIKSEMEQLAAALRPSGWAGGLGTQPRSAPVGTPVAEPGAGGDANLAWLLGTLAGDQTDESPDEESPSEHGAMAEQEPPPEPVPEPTSPPGPDPEPERETSLTTPPRAQPAGALILADTGSALVDVVVSGEGHDIEIVALEEDGSLVRWRAGAETARSRLPVGRSLGLAAAADGRVFFVEGEGRIADVSLSARGHEIVHSCAPGAMVCCAGHPFGKHVAFARAGEAGIQVFAAATERVDELVPEPAVPTALAFANTGRHLAAGDAQGAVTRIDMLRKSAELLGDAGVGAEVLLLAAAPGGAWAAVFGGGDLVMWDTGGHPAARTSVDGRATALTVDAVEGRVAVGAGDGVVRVWSADLVSVLFDERLHEGQVQRLAFVDGQLVSAGADGLVLLIKV